MGNPYSASSITGYNSNPPADDGSEVASNQVTWAKHKDKLGDPLKTLAESIDSNVTTAFGKIFGNTINTQSTTYQVLASDQGKIVSVTNTVTVTLVAAGTAGSNFTFAVLNAGTGTVTLDGNASETINGSTTLTLAPQEFMILSCDGSNWTGLGGIPQSNSQLPRSYLAGLGLSNDAGDTAHDIAIAVGEARDATNAANLRLTSIITKQIDADWAEGDDAGGFPSALTLAESWYRVFIISKTDGTVDAGFDTSATAANLLSDASTYTYYRQIGWVLTDSSFNIQQFAQRGDEYIWTDRSAIGLDISSAISTSAALHTLSAPPSTKARFNTSIYLASNTSLVYLTEVDADDEAPATTATPLSTNMQLVTGVSLDGNQPAIVAEMWVDASSQIRSRALSTPTLYLQTIGWTDRRGRDD